MSIPSDLELRFLLLCRALELPEPVTEYSSRRRGAGVLTPAGRRSRWPWSCEGGTWCNGRHTRGKGFELDCYKYNTAATARAGPSSASPPTMLDTPHTP